MTTATQTQEYVVIVIDDNDPDNETQICSMGGYSKQEAEDIACDMAYRNPDLRYDVITLEHAQECGIE